MEIKNDVLVKVTDEDITDGIFIIPEYITEIGAYAFSHCKLLVTLNIPNNVHKIGYGAFHECEYLKKIKIPEGITTIECYTFRGCTYLKEIEIPESVTIIEKEAFALCKSLKEITIPKNVTELPIDLFCGCCSLTNVNILGKIERIKGGAFYGCTKLKNMIIPSSIKSIDENAFKKCYKYDLVLPSSFISLSFQGLDVRVLKINKKLVRTFSNDNRRFGFNIKTLIKKELLVKIKEKLKERNINDKKYLKYKEHEIFINTKTNEIFYTYQINIEEELDNYIVGYLIDKGLLEEKVIAKEKNFEYIEKSLINENRKINEDTLLNSDTLSEGIIKDNVNVSKEVSVKNGQQEIDINEVLIKLSKLPKEEIALIMDMVKNNIFDENIEKYINMSNEERIKNLESVQPQQPYKVILEKEPIENYIAKQKLKKLKF